MDQLVAPKPPPPPSSLTDAATRALEQLRSDLEARYRIVARGINANAGAVLAKAPASDPSGAAEQVAARYRGIRGYQPTPLQRAGRTR